MGSRDRQVDSLLAVYNRESGGAEEEARAEALGTLRAGADVTVFATGGDDELQHVLATHQGQRLVVLGGDGSVHAVVGALHRLGLLGSRVVGLVPLGTANDLARTLRIPLDAAAAAQVVLAGQERPIDLLVDDTGGIVVNAVHLGVGAEGARQAKPLKPALGRFAYAVGAVLGGLRARGWKVRVVVDGRVVADGHRRVLMVGLGNGATIGGSTTFAPTAVPDDGEVDVMVSFATSMPARLAYGILLRRGRHVRRHDVALARGGQVRVTAGEPVPVNADGEVGNAVSDRTWTVEPRVLRMTVPG